MQKQVPSDSLEWANVDYQVQLATGKSSVKLVSLLKYEDNRSDALSEKGWVDGIVNLTDFSGDYCRQVAEYRIPLADVIFYCGHVNIHRYHNQPYKIFTFLLCRVRLGLAGTPSTPQLEDCDSVLVQPEIEQQAFQYNFFLKNHSQYDVKYEVKFTVGDDKDFKLSDYQCCNCQNRTPSIYCATEKLYFCEECCADHHKTKLMHSHQLEEIDRINTLENCKSHNQKYQFYCLKCEKYLCGYCTQKGVHSQNNDHPVKPVKYIYDEAAENALVLPKKPLEKVEALSYNLKIKRKEVDENYQQVKAQIEADYKKSLAMLDSEVAKKLQMLDSCDLELGMLKDRIEWSLSFAEFQRNSLKPIHYFKSESKFEAFIKKLKVSQFEGIFLCKPDLVYEGDNRVGTRDFLERMPPKKTSEQYLKDPSMSRAQKNKSNEQVSAGGIDRSLLSYNPQAEAPKRGELSLQLQNSKLNFFTVRSKS